MAQETRNAYGEKLAELIKENPNIVVLDADLTKSTKTIEAKNACPERHFNAGIAECNMMGMAAGLAASPAAIPIILHSAIPALKCLSGHAFFASIVLVDLVKSASNTTMFSLDLINSASFSP